MYQDAAIEDLARARKRYYQRDLSPAEQAAELDTIITKLDEAFPQFFKAALGHPGLNDEAGRRRANRKCLETWFHFGSMAAPFFSLKFFFPEVAQNGGFDIVIGNPPYGGTPIPDPLKTSLNLGSKDPYGAFISRFIAHEPPLKRHGVLAYIVSDTFMTIKSHKPLREQILQSFIHRMIRVHPDTFNATVNTAIIVLEREIPPTEPDRKSLIPDDHSCLMADLTHVSIHENYSRFLQLLYRTTAASEIGKDTDEGIHIMTGETWRSESSPEYALYSYPQNLIRSNSNIPLFVASPKLFALMNDTDAPLGYRDIEGKRVPVRAIEINGQTVSVIKLGEIAEVKQGLATGDNKAYLFQNPEARGNYLSIEDYRKFLITEKDLERIRSDESLRLMVIANGISKEPSNPTTYFSGRYILPYDKGGESDAEGGWMPNYWVKTDYYIDWSEMAVRRLKTYTIGDRDGYERNQLCSVIRNPGSYFQYALTFSSRGVYAPTFRLNAGSVYDKESSGIFTIKEPRDLLAILPSKFIRYLLKSIIQVTVSMDVDALKELVLINKNLPLSGLLSSIISQQKSNPRYDYASNEQIEIDRLVYEAYGLNEDDIREVENWYARRYPALAAAQRANLERKLAAEKETAR
jgi:hypothetical protein